MKYKIAIFDMDGTILNTLDDIANAINHTLTVFNMPVRSIDEVRSFVGNGLNKLCERAVVPGTSESILSDAIVELRSFYQDHSNETTGFCLCHDLLYPEHWPLAHPYGYWRSKQAEHRRWSYRLHHHDDYFCSFGYHLHTPLIAPSTP